MELKKGSRSNQYAFVGPSAVSVNWFWLKGLRIHESTKRGDDDRKANILKFEDQKINNLAQHNWSTGSSLCDIFNIDNTEKEARETVGGITEYLVQSRSPQLLKRKLLFCGLNIVLEPDLYAVFE